MALPLLWWRSVDVEGENSVLCPPSMTLRLIWSGYQLVVFLSWVRGGSSPVFLRRSRYSSMS